MRLNGLIRRIARARIYALTPEEQHIATFYTKLYNRLLSPLVAATSRKPGPTTPGPGRDRPPYRLAQLKPAV